MATTMMSNEDSLEYQIKNNKFDELSFFHLVNVQKLPIKQFC